MKKILLLAFVLITTLSYSQNIVFKQPIQTNQKSLVINNYKPELSTAVTNLYLRDNDNTTKVAAVSGYILLNSIATTTYFIMNESNKINRPNSPKLNPTGLIFTTVTSTALLVIIISIH
jgi:hypothetical protein